MSWQASNLAHPNPSQAGLLKSLAFHRDPLTRRNLEILYSRDSPATLEVRKRKNKAKDCELPLLAELDVGPTR